MSSTAINLTVDVTERQVIMTDTSDKGVAILVAADANLGTGTLSLLAQPLGFDDDFDPEVIDASLAVGAQFNYDIGSNMRVYVTLASSTSANIDVMISTYK